jgi:hypothetical protein
VEKYAEEFMKLWRQFNSNIVEKKQEDAAIKIQ